MVLVKPYAARGLDGEERMGLENIFSCNIMHDIPSGRV